MVQTQPRIYIDTWNPECGRANEIEEADEPKQYATIPDGEPFGFVASPNTGPLRLAFIDGIQQIELHVVQIVEGRSTPGIACVFAVGAVTIEPGQRAAFSHLRTRRMVIWTAGATGGIPDVPGRLALG